MTLNKKQEESRAHATLYHPILYLIPLTAIFLLLLPLPLRNHRRGLSLTFKAQSLRSARLLPSPALLLCVTFFTLVTLSPSMMVSSLSSFSSRAWTSLRHFPLSSHLSTLSPLMNVSSLSLSLSTGLPVCRSGFDSHSARYILPCIISSCTYLPSPQSSCFASSPLQKSPSWP